jgi:hypothetical protein
LYYCFECPTILQLLACRVAESNAFSVPDRNALWIRAEDDLLVQDVSNHSTSDVLGRDWSVVTSEMSRHPNTGQNLLMSGTDLLNGGTGTVVSQLSESGQGIMCTKEGIGKYDMWYGVVCKTVMSWTSSVFSLGGGRDTVSFLVIPVNTCKVRSHFETFFVVYYESRKRE